MHIPAIDGFEFSVSIQSDDSQELPWEASDGHGPVSDWRKAGCNGRASKAPGELLLCDDNPSGLRYTNAARFYDFQEACRIALRDGWNAAPYDISGETKRQRAARAARADFERLRAWCDGSWEYVGIVVTCSRNGIDLASASLWGVESDSGDYLQECAQELAQEALETAREQVAALCDCDGAAA